MKFFHGNKNKKTETMRALIMKLHTRSVMWVIITALCAAVVSGIVIARTQGKNVTKSENTEVMNRYYEAENDTEATLVTEEMEEAFDIADADPADAANVNAMQEELDSMADAMKESKELLDTLYETLGTGEDTDSDLMNKISAIRVSVGSLNRNIEKTESTLTTLRTGSDSESIDISALASLQAQMESLRSEREKTAGNVEEVAGMIRSGNDFDADAAVNDLTTQLMQCMNDEIDAGLNDLSNELKAEIDSRMDAFVASALAQMTPEASGTESVQTAELLATIETLEQQIATLQKQNEEILSAIGSIPSAPVQTVTTTVSSAESAAPEEETIIEEVPLAELTDAEKKQLMEAMMDAQILYRDEFKEAYDKKRLTDDVDWMITEELYSDYY